MTVCAAALPAAFGIIALPFWAWEEFSSWVRASSIEQRYMLKPEMGEMDALHFAGRSLCLLADRQEEMGATEATSFL